MFVAAGVLVVITAALLAVWANAYWDIAKDPMIRRSLESVFFILQFTACKGIINFITTIPGQKTQMKNKYKP